MTTADLKARGFVEVPRLPQPFTYCTVCRTYTWFMWWQAPKDELGIKVCACRDCHSVPTNDEKHVERFPIVKTVAA